jgi:cytochrome d ubiquinol oxidase subunit II
MIPIWYAILSFMLLMFVVLEGFDIGAGMLQYIVGKTESERRLVIAAIGPLWSWHEVWLVGFGGTLLLAFPTILAASFAGFYMALFLLLWCLVLRGVSIEVSGHIADPLWRSAWHFCFVTSNVLLAILVGVALGNILRGVPVGADGKFALSLFTNFSARGNVGILDWFTLGIAVFIVATFAAHGAVGLGHRTTGVVRLRSLKLAQRLWRAVVGLLVIISIAMWYVRSDVLDRMFHHPLGWLGLIAVVTGLIVVFFNLNHENESPALIGSCVFISGLIIAGAAGVFPFMLQSTLDPKYSLSAYQNAADGHGLAIALVWWPVAFCFAVGYFLFIFRYYSGKVIAAQDTQRPY